MFGKGVQKVDEKNHSSYFTGSTLVLQGRMDSITQMISSRKHWSICKRQRWKEECFKKKMFQNYEKSTMDQLRKCKMTVLTWLCRSTNLNNTRKSPKGVLRLLGTQDFGRDGCKFSTQESKDLLLQKKPFPKQVLLSRLPNHTGCPNLYLRLLSSFVFIGQRSPFVNSLERMHFCINSTTLHVRLYEWKTRPRECFSSLSVFLP